MWFLFASGQRAEGASDDLPGGGENPGPSQEPSETPGSDNSTGSDTPGHDFDHSFHDGPDAFRGERLESKSESRSDRATGDFSSSSLSERACTMSDAIDSAKGLNEQRADAIEKLLKGLNEFDARENSTPAIRSSGIEESKPGERSSGWGGYLDMLAGKARAAKEGVVDFVGGVEDFLDNRTKMIDINTIGADKYFHCMANCEAAQRGPGGVLAASLMSEFREAADSITNVYVKGLTEEASTADCQADMHANLTGRQAGIDGTRCYDACRTFEPRWEHK